MCHILEVSRSAYYAWKKRGKSQRQQVNEDLIERIVQIYKISHRIYGSPRITQELRSEDFKELAQMNGFVQSISRKGSPYDDAIVETFFHSLKTEWVNFNHYQTRDQAAQSIFEYIETFYNRIRRHSSLGYLSPQVFVSKQSKTAELRVYFFGGRSIPP